MTKGRSRRGGSAKSNVRKTVSVERAKLEQVRALLGAPTDAEAIRRAIEYVLIRHRPPVFEEEE